VAVSFGTELPGKGGEALGQPLHGLGKVEPAEAVGDLGRGPRTPEGRILGPEPADITGLFEAPQPRFERRLELAEAAHRKEPVGAASRGATFLPPLPKRAHDTLAARRGLEGPAAPECFIVVSFPSLPLNLPCSRGKAHRSLADDDASLGRTPSAEQRRGAEGQVRLMIPHSGRSSSRAAESVFTISAILRRDSSVSLTRSNQASSLPRLESSTLRPPGQSIPRSVPEWSFRQNPEVRAECPDEVDVSRDEKSGGAGIRPAGWDRGRAGERRRAASQSRR
jgi:hypothetical protein